MMGLNKTEAMDTGNFRYQFVAGNLALDFVNTVAYRADAGKQHDLLLKADDVHRWATQAHLPDVAAMEAGPKVGPAAIRRLRDVRERLFAVFRAIANDNAVSADALVRIGNTFNECCAKRRLSSDDAEIQWGWRASARYADYLLYPVLAAATDLLTSDARGLVRQCEDAGCGWLFLDRSNARKRRWCSMADCGNRNKARNFYRRDVD